MDDKPGMLYGKLNGDFAPIVELSEQCPHKAFNSGGREVQERASQGEGLVLAFIGAEGL